jgi:hypothetical protein
MFTVSGWLQRGDRKGETVLVNWNGPADLSGDPSLIAACRAAVIAQMPVAPIPTSSSVPADLSDGSVAMFTTTEVLVEAC